VRFIYRRSVFLFVVLAIVFSNATDYPWVLFVCLLLAIALSAFNGRIRAESRIHAKVVGAVIGGLSFLVGALLWDLLPDSRALYFLSVVVVLFASVVAAIEAREAFGPFE
jgi:hypothetical protein